MRKPVFVVSMFALTLAVAPACATKKFVRTEVGQVNDKVTTMGSSLEQTQERVRQNEGANHRSRHARAGRRIEGRRAQPTPRSRPRSRANDGVTKRQHARRFHRSASRKILFEVVLSEDQGKFKFGDAELPDEAKSAIDSMVNNIKSQKARCGSRSRVTPTTSATRSTTSSSASSAPKP